MSLTGRHSTAPPLDPEDGVAVLRFEDEGDRNPYLFRPPTELEDLVRLLTDLLQLPDDARERIHHRDVFISVLFEELAAVIECKTSLAGWHKPEEELRSFSQVGAGLEH